MTDGKEESEGDHLLRTHPSSSVSHTYALGLLVPWKTSASPGSAPLHPALPTLRPPCGLRTVVWRFAPRTFPHRLDRKCAQERLGGILPNSDHRDRDARIVAPLGYPFEIPGVGPLVGATMMCFRFLSSPESGAYAYSIAGYVSVPPLATARAEERTATIEILDRRVHKRGTAACCRQSRHQYVPSHDPRNAGMVSS